METNDVAPFPQTIVNVYNNTLVVNGWRRGAAEPGRGVSVDLNARANIYNNIMVNNYQGLEIFTDADTINTVYGNNLFYASADTYTDTTKGRNISINYPVKFLSRRWRGQTPGFRSDLDSGRRQRPAVQIFDGKIATANGAATTNDFHLNAGSPAIGKGNSTYNADIGAYTSDGQG